MRACVGVALFLAGCATSKADPVDAGVDATDAADEPVTICISNVTCTTVADCAANGGVAACWSCLIGCCVPLPPTANPQKTCDAGGACQVSTCDGMGSCSRAVPARNGTPCGSTCGGVFVYATSTCHEGFCDGDSNSQTACPERCFGDYTGCDICDSPGCVASCNPIAKHGDRCFP